jgi:hypothetical protein
MATYAQIQWYVGRNFGFQPKTCWIAHVKELNHLVLGAAPNRYSVRRTHPCPPNKRAAIETAFRHSGMM